MLLNPSILALVMVSGIVSGMTLLAAGFAMQVMRHWNLQSGSELQLRLERRTYLISTLVAYGFVAQLIALLLFIYNAEQLSSQFVGAMCATGVLNVDPFGWPTLYLKIALFFAGAAWLILNQVDNLARDYPLIRVKYTLLLAIAPLMLAEFGIQLTYFTGMDPDVITSCCGSLFTPEGSGVAAEMAGIAPGTSLVMLAASGMAALLSGLLYLRRRRGSLAFAGFTTAAFPVALVAIVSCIALYVYEHPNHHCPFCILKEGHDFIGYYLYIPLFAAAAMALGVGTIAPFQRVPSLQGVIPRLSRRYVTLALLLLAAFYAVAGGAIFNSSLTMLTVWW